MLKNESVDHVIIAVSVDYLIRPYDVFKEVSRILKSG
jgi:ubiquinone/menaquinone biosynthesis C-methylase UbiE